MLSEVITCPVGLNETNCGWPWRVYNGSAWYTASYALSQDNTQVILSGDYSISKYVCDDTFDIFDTLTRNIFHIANEASQTLYFLQMTLWHVEKLTWRRKSGCDVTTENRARYLTLLTLSYSLLTDILCCPANQQFKFATRGVRIHFQQCTTRSTSQHRSFQLACQSVLLTCLPLALHLPSQISRPALNRLLLMPHPTRTPTRSDSISCSSSLEWYTFLSSWKHIFNS